MASKGRVELTTTCPYGGCSETKDVSVFGDHGTDVYAVVECPGCDKFYTIKVAITISGAITYYTHA